MLTVAKTVAQGLELVLSRFFGLVEHPASDAARTAVADAIATDVLDDADPPQLRQDC